MGCNKLYGTSMCQYSPTGHFAKIEVTERSGDIFLKSVLNTKDDHKPGSSVGFDLKYPQNRHKKLNVSHYFQRNKQ